MKNLTQNDITEVKGQANPNEATVTIVKAVMIIIGKKPDKVLNTKTGKKEDDYWTKASTKLMKNPKQVLAFLLEFAEKSKRDIPQKAIKKFSKDIRDHPDFNESRAKTVGKAISGFYYFASAMYNFKVVFDNAAPLREKLRVAQDILEKKETDLAAKQKNLKTIQDNLAKL